jgi:rhombotail lipoprotein
MKVKVLLVTSLALLSSGCTWMFRDGHRSAHRSSTPLVDFLYGSREVPSVDATVELQLPIRVGVSFLPSADGHANDGPPAADREKMLASIREHFSARKYVSEIVVVPDYYLRAGTHGNGTDGFTQLQQLARLHRLDLFALVSYDQILHGSANKRSIAYLTIVGSYLVRGDRHETHTLLDLAVVDPRSRSLVMRAGGTSSLGGNTTALEAEQHARAQRAQGFELAGTALIANFDRELTVFEQRVREGGTPVRVTRRAPGAGGGGGGAVDPLLLAALAAALGLTAGARAWRGRRSSASAPR